MQPCTLVYTITSDSPDLHNNYCTFAGCGDVDLSSHQNAIVSSYSYGVVNGSEATVVCEEGYDLITGDEKMTLRCTNEQWYRVKTNEDGSEELKLRWTVLCYPSPCK